MFISPTRRRALNPGFRLKVFIAQIILPIKTHALISALKKAP
jgi:hypothetical protein